MTPMTPMNLLALLTYAWRNGWAHLPSANVHPVLVVALLVLYVLVVRMRRSYDQRQRAARARTQDVWVDTSHEDALHTLAQVLYVIAWSLGLTLLARRVQYLVCWRATLWLYLCSPERVTIARVGLREAQEYLIGRLHHHTLAPVAVLYYTLNDTIACAPCVTLDIQPHRCVVTTPQGARTSIHASDVITYTTNWVTGLPVNVTLTEQHFWRNPQAYALSGHTHAELIRLTEAHLRAPHAPDAPDPDA